MTIGVPEVSVNNWYYGFIKGKKEDILDKLSEAKVVKHPSKYTLAHQDNPKKKKEKKLTAEQRALKETLNPTPEQKKEREQAHQKYRKESDDLKESRKPLKGDEGEHTKYRLTSDTEDQPKGTRNYKRYELGDSRVKVENLKRQRQRVQEQKRQQAQSEKDSDEAYKKRTEGFKESPKPKSGDVDYKAGKPKGEGTPYSKLDPSVQAKWQDRIQQEERIQRHKPKQYPKVDPKHIVTNEHPISTQGTATDEAGVGGKVQEGGKTGKYEDETDIYTGEKIKSLRRGLLLMSLKGFGDSKAERARATDFGTKPESEADKKGILLDHEGTRSPERVRPKKLQPRGEYKVGDKEITEARGTHVPERKPKDPKKREGRSEEHIKDYEGKQRRIENIRANIKQQKDVQPKKRRELNPKTLEYEEKPDGTKYSARSIRARQDMEDERHFSGDKLTPAEEKLVKPKKTKEGKRVPSTSARTHFQGEGAKKLYEELGGQGLQHAKRTRQAGMSEEEALEERKKQQGLSGKKESKPPKLIAPSHFTGGAKVKWEKSDQKGREAMEKKYKRSQAHKKKSIIELQGTRLRVIKTQQMMTADSPSPKRPTSGNQGFSGGFDKKPEPEGHSVPTPKDGRHKEAFESERRIGDEVYQHPTRKKPKSNPSSPKHHRQDQRNQRDLDQEFMRREPDEKFERGKKDRDRRRDRFGINP